MKIQLFKIRLSNEFVQQDQDSINSFLESVAVKKTSCQLINDHPNYWSILVFYDKMTIKEPRSDKPERISYPAGVPLTSEEQTVLAKLKIWRQTKANELSWPVYMICNNSELISLVKSKPESLDQLVKIKGFGDQKIAKLGEEIIAFFNSI